VSVVLVINSGSSSLKYSLIDVHREQELASGLIERIGQPVGTVGHTVRTIAEPGEPTIALRDLSFSDEQAVADHDVAFALMLAQFAEHGPQLAENPPTAIGHRVVHGGARFFAPTVVTAQVEADIEDLIVLAPLHNPANLASIRAARAAFPDVPHVTVFDTAFHQTLPAPAYTYAIDAELAREHRIRRYGFHGTSHKYVSETAAAFVERPLDQLRQLVFHLGNGASVTAIDAGRSVETSMGFTPLEGLVMGTRSGDIDPAVQIHLSRRTGMDAEQLDTLLNKRSGLLGLAGRSDMRDILAGRASGDETATLAYDVYIHRLRAYAGAYIAQLGGVDVISFTAGIGENAADVRADALSTLEFMGIRIDAERNAQRSNQPRRISTDDSTVEVLVVPTDEELEIARQALSVI